MKGKSWILGALFAVALTSTPALAQQFREIAAGWTGVAAAPASDANKFEPRPYVRGSIGNVLAPRVRIRFDADAMFFRLGLQEYPPCPLGGCGRKFYEDHTRGIVGLTANALVGLDPREIVYVIGGIGAYGAFAEQNTLEVGASAGAGVAIPVGVHWRAFAEATWHILVPNRGGPSWVAPLAVGLRF